MRVVDQIDPTAYIRRALTAVLGIPLAAELEAEDAQGSLGVYFHEGKNRKGETSKRVMAITNKHVTSKDTKSDYEYSGRPGAPQKFIYNCSRRRFEQVVNETRASIPKKLGEAKLFAELLAEMPAKPESDNNNEVAADKLAAKRRKEDLDRVKDNVGILDEFIKLLNSTWSDAYQRILGWLDWAPKITNNLDECRYTRDLSVFVLDDVKFQKNFKGNYVYLGAFCSSFISLLDFHPAETI